jgi:uncharacterized membrane protein
LPVSGSQVEAMIQHYLDRVAEQLRDLPPEERAEIINDLRVHIEEAIGDPTYASEAQVRNVLDRLGDPADLAREARSRASGDAAERPPVYRRISKSPGALEVIAIVLTALFWPIGVILAWLSPRWLTRDKVIATVIPIISFLILVAAAFPALVVTGSTGTVIEPQEVYVSPGQPQSEIVVPPQRTESRGFVAAIGSFAVVMLFLVGGFGGPFISAIYLAIRLQPLEEHYYPDGTRASTGIPAGAA